MARLEVVHVQACDLVYMLQLQHVLAVLVPLLYLQNLRACGGPEMVAAGRSAPLSLCPGDTRKVEVLCPG